MPVLTPHALRFRPLRRRGLAGFTLALLVLAGSTPASAACPWVVQPYISEATLKDARPTFDITLQEVRPGGVLYAFTVASAELAWQLASRQTLSEMKNALPLEGVVTPIGATVYRLHPDTLEPPTIYLLAASGPIEKLERIAARIEPSRPVAVALGTRGASDRSGALPRRSVPGIEVADADRDAFTLCAYQVSSTG
jgi:hypothetical protein